MKIELILYASLRHYLPEQNGKNSCMVEVEEGTTIGRLLAKLQIPAEAAKILFRNGVHVKSDEVLKDGDRVGAFPPVAGG